MTGIEPQGPTDGTYDLSDLTLLEVHQERGGAAIPLDLRVVQEPGSCDSHQAGAATTPPGGTEGGVDGSRVDQTVHHTRRRRWHHGVDDRHLAKEDGG